MVAIFTGNGLGFQRGSASVLGSAGSIGGAGLGRGNDNVLVNAATGNLIVNRQDEFLIGRGPDANFTETYNSQSGAGSAWTQGLYHVLGNQTGKINKNGSTITRTDGDGHGTLYTYDVFQGAYVATEGGGAHDRLTYNFGSWTWTDGDSQVTETYTTLSGAPGLSFVSSASDIDGNTQTYSWSATGTLQRITNANGDYVDFTITNGLPTQITTYYAAGNTVSLTRARYVWDTQQRLTSVTVDLTPYDHSVADGNVYTTTYTYDGTSSRIASITQTDGSRVDITYVLVGADYRVATLSQAVSNGVSRNTNFSYDTVNRITTITDASGQSVQLHYDAAKQLTRIVAPPAVSGGAAQTRQFAYNSVGDVTLVTDGLGDSSSFEYDLAGNLILSRDALGNTVTRTYGEQNELLTETVWHIPDPDGAGAATAGAPSTTRFAYDSELHLRFVATQEGRITEHRYNAAGQRVSTHDYSANRYELGWWDPTITIEEADLANWAAAIADKTTIGRVDMTYDVRGNVASATSYSATLADGSGNLAAVYSRSTFVYDPAGRLLSRVASDLSGTEHFVYDGLGRIVSSTDSAGATTIVTRNDASLTTTTTFANGLTRVDVFNKAGEMLSTTQSASSITTSQMRFKYDQLGRVRIAIDPLNRTSHILYDNRGRKVADIAPDGAVTEYVYDADDRLTVTIAYLNRLNAAQLASLTDGAGNPANVTLASIRPGAHADDLWTWNVYDRSDRIIETIDSAGRATTFSYDGASLLVSSTSYATPFSPAWIAWFKSSPPVMPYLPGSNAATDRTGRNFYDNDGNLVGTLSGNGGLTQIFYDGAGQAVRQISYAKTASAGLRATGTFAQLLADVGVNAADRRSDSVYDRQGLLRFVVDADGHPTEMIYDAAGRLTRTINYAGAIATSASYSLDYVQGQIGAAGLASNPATRITRQVYDAAGRLAFSIDAEGGAVAFAYDLVGNVIKQTQYAAVFTATGDQTIAAMQGWAAGHAGDAGNRVSRQIFDAAGQLAYAVDAEGFVSELRYDVAGQVTQTIRYPSAYAVSDGATKASLAAQIGAIPAAAVVLTYAYDSTGQVTDMTDAEGVVTHYTYDALGQVIDETIAYGTADASTLRRVYDPVGRVIRETRGHGTAEAATTAYGFDAVGNLLTVTDPRGFTTTRTYDAMGCVLSTTMPINASANATVSSVYNRFGDVVQVTDALGNSSYNYYDRLGRVVATRDTENYITESSYNVFGETTSVTRRANRANNPPGEATLPIYSRNRQDATTLFDYDRRGQLVKTTDAEGYYEQFTFDAFGQQISARNRLGAVTTSAYDRRGLLVAQTLPVSSVRSDGSLQAASVTNRFEYDSRGNRTRMVEAFGLSEQRTTTYIYDKADRVVETRGDAITVLSQSDHYSQTVVTPTERLVYDKRGNLIEAVNRLGARTLYFYDRLNRRVADINALGALTTYVHDANGNVTNARVYATAVALPGAAGGNPPAAPGGDYRETSFTFDRLNRMLTSSVTGLRTGNWNGSSFVMSVGSVTTAAYQYDAQGNIVAATDANGGVTYSSYDKLGRALTSVDAEGFLTSWTYDAEGNILSERRAALQATGVGTASPSAAAHADDRITYFTYDRNGLRLTEQRAGVAAWTVSATGMLTYTPSTSTIVYTYNGLGQVTRKTEATGEYVDYVYDATGRLVTENRAAYADQSGNLVLPTVDYAYNGLNQLTRTRQGGQAAVAGDRITRNDYGPGGRLASVTDATGSVYVYAYDAGGNVVRESYSRQRSDGTSVSEAILYTRDLLGRTVAQSVATANGATWLRGDIQTLAYNGFGEVSSRGLNGLWQERFDYDRAGRLWRTNSQDGVWRYFIQDGNGNQTLSIDSEGTDLADKTIEQVLAIATGNGAHGVGAAYVDGINTTINVYDRRNMAVTTRLPKRQLSEGGTITDLVVGRSYTAFGEIAWETDAAGNRTDFAYNTMGRTLSVRRPMVSITLENGTVQNVNPTDYVVYDIAGRAIGTIDANGNLMTRRLLAGTGYGNSDGTAVAEFHADGGVIRSGYDVFGDLRRSTDEVGRVTEMTYDGRGRLTQVIRPSTLVDNYAYDLLGQRIQHWNNVLQVPIYGPPEDIWIDESYWDPETGQWIETGHWETHTPIIGYSPDKELTDYDLQGRVTRQVAFGGDVTTTTYAWDSQLATGGMGVFGGWVQTTTYANGRTMVEKADMFGHDLYKKDLGDHVFAFSYDRAGRMAERTGGGKTLTYSYLNLGLLGSLSTMTGSLGDAYEIERAVYGYDVNGNKISERFEKEGARWIYNWHGFSGGKDSGGGSGKEDSGGGVAMAPIDPPDDPPDDPELVPYYDIYQNATATYDALGRMRSWSEVGNATTPAANIQYEYDANGNVRRIRAEYSTIDAHGGTAAGALKDHWYRYDAMNRVVTSKGVLDNGQIRRGTEGVDILYDAAGQRASIRRTTWENAYIWDPNAITWDEWGNPTYGSWVQTSYEGETRENYGYNAGGYLSTVRIAKSGYIDNGDGTVTATPAEGPGELKSSHTHDLLGRLTRQIDWLGDGTNAAYDHTIVYNEKGQIRSDTVISKQGADTIQTNTGNEFVARNADPVTSYALGAVVYVATQTIKNGVHQSWAETKNSYVWWDGAQQDHVTYTNLSTPNVPANHTQYYYDSAGQLTSVNINDGRPRTVTFFNNIGGQALRRDETNSTTGAPHEIWYRYDGRQLGYTGNNGTLETDYQTSISTRTLTPGNGAFRFGQSYGSAYADFDQNYSAINSYAQGSAGGSYTARTGDTLSSIAANLWGDGALWYQLAEANGMSANTGLVEGQQLTIPAGIVKNHHNSSTFKPYDASDVLGDVSPTTPRPQALPKKGNKCGIFGQILLVVIAVAVTALTYGAASAALGPVLGGALAGAAGSAASQAFGVVTGIQDKFDWKAVAMGAISGAVSGAVGKIPFLKAGGGKFADFAKDIARGALASAVTQGIGVATGLQGKFSWAGVAAAGVGAGVTGAVGRELGVKPLEENNLLSNHLKLALATSAGAIASAATQSVIDGTDFGDNLLAALPDIIGGTVGNMIAHGVSLPEKPPPQPMGSGMAAPRLRDQNGEVQFLNASMQDDDGKTSLIMCVQSGGETCLAFDKFKDAPDGSFHKRKYHAKIAELRALGIENPTERQIALALEKEAIANSRVRNVKEMLRGGMGDPFSPSNVLPILGDIFQNKSGFDKGLDSVLDFMGEANQLLEDHLPEVADFVNGFLLGEGSERDSWSAEFGKIISGLTPPGDVRDTLISFMRVVQQGPTTLTVGVLILSVAGWIPGAGDGAKSIGKKVLAWGLKRFPYLRRLDDAVDYMLYGIKKIRNLDIDDAVAGFKAADDLIKPEYAKRIAELSTQTHRKAERVVLGPSGDYIADAERHGGRVLNTEKDVYDKITEGMTKAQADDTFWHINQAFLDQSLKSGLPIQFVGNWKSHIAKNPNSFTAKEVKYLKTYAPNYGYKWSGSSWIKVK